MRGPMERREGTRLHGIRCGSCAARGLVALEWHLRRLHNTSKHATAQSENDDLTARASSGPGPRLLLQYLSKSYMYTTACLRSSVCHRPTPRLDT